MAKKAPQSKPTPIAVAAEPLTEVAPKGPKWYEGHLIGWLSLPWQLAIIALLALALYANTWQHELALDDGVVIQHNSYVQEGVAGIPKIFGGDAFESFSNQQNAGNQLTGGRYRPLSIITFALEQELLGLDQRTLTDTSQQDRKAFQESKRQKIAHDMHFRHGVNILLYMLTCMLVLILLHTIIFQKAPLAAFLTALIFTVHPIHTEVVANVKSRDELLSVLFIALTCLAAFAYNQSKKPLHMVASMVALFLALLSKEYAVVMVVLLPAMLYYFTETPIGAAFKKSWYLLVPLLIYVAVRQSAVSAPGEAAEGDIMNNPYVWATPVEKLATEFYVLLQYIKLLVWPHPLVADYSYNTIPYTSFSNPLVLLSIALYIGCIVYMVRMLGKRHVLSFAIFTFLLFLAPICNIFINIGAPMGERLVFHASLGFAMAVGYGLHMLYHKLPSAAIAKPVLVSLLAVIVALSFIKTIDRNKDWKNSNTLFLHDVALVPNSVMVNTNAGGAWIDASEQAKDTMAAKACLQHSIQHFTKALQINYRYTNASVNRAICYLKLHEMDSALADVDTINKYYPLHPFLPRLSATLAGHYINEGLAYAQAGNNPMALVSFEKLTRAAPTNPDYWYNLAMAYAKLQQKANAQRACAKALQIAPNHAPSLQLMPQLNALP